MTAILGISAYYHDSAAALIQDGEIVAAAQEERFSRVKHDARFPHRAIRYCLAQAGLTCGDLDLVGFCPPTCKWRPGGSRASSGRRRSG
jgi:carbamoyltransferase